MKDFPSRRQFLATASVTACGLIIARGVVAQPAPTRRVRKEVRKLSMDSAALNRFRAAMRVLQGKGGPNGYQDLAGFHGVPKWHCPHGDSLFLPWHRAYILAIEDELQKIDPTVTLPFWDWTSSESIQSGIPDAYADRTYDNNGVMDPNPLFSAKIDPLGRDTRRLPRHPSLLAGYAARVRRAFNETSYDAFHSAIEGPHVNLHTWVRLDMGSQSYAAYDPIFWAHHSNVDRQWAQWQLGPNNALPSNTILNTDLVPFGKKVKDVIEFREQLNYDYDDIEAMPPNPILATGANNLVDVQGFEIQRKNSTVMLVAHDVDSSTQSLNIDVFINLPGANEKTNIKDNIHFAGSFGIFGSGKQDHHGRKFTGPVMDISQTVHAITKGEKGNLSVKFVVTDMNGKLVDNAKLPLKGITIQQQ